MWSEHFQDVDTDVLRNAVIPPQEEFIKGWLVVFINEYRQEQERVLLLSKEALYRVKFNFSNQKILRFQRTAISEISLIEKGIIGDFDSKYYGFKLYYKDTFFTFRPVVDEAHLAPIEVQQNVVESIVQHIAKAKRISLQLDAVKSDQTSMDTSKNDNDTGFSQDQLDTYMETFIIEVDNLKIAGALPVLSLAHNALGLGMQRPKKKPTQKVKDTLPSTDQPPPMESVPSEPDPTPRVEAEPSPSSSLEAQAPINAENNPILDTASENDNNNNENIRISSESEPGAVEIMQQVPSTVAENEIKPVSYVEILLSYLNKVNSRTVAQLLDQIDSESHYIYGVVFAFFLGYWNFSILWIIVVLYVIQTYTSSKWTKFHNKRKQHNLHHVNVMLPAKSHKRGQSFSAPVSESGSMEKITGPASSSILPADPLSNTNPPAAVSSVTTSSATAVEATRTPSNEFLSNKTLPPINLFGSNSNSNISYPFNIVSMIETTIEMESCEWFNTMMSQLWKYMVKHLSESAKETSISLLQNSLFNKTTDSEGFSLTALEISEFYLGDSSPTIKNMIASKPEFPDFRIECDVHFNVGPNGKVLADLIVTRGSAVTIKVPLSIDSLVIEGRMRFEFVFFSRYPYIHSMRYTFLEPPQTNMAIKPLCTFNVMALPFLKDYLASHLQQLLETSIVFPYQLSMLYFNLFSLQPTYDDTALMSPEDLSKHIPLVEKAERDGDFAGLLHVRVVEAKKLNTDVMGGMFVCLYGSYCTANSCPYCILSIGTQVLTTRAFKVPRARNPIWNEFFELLITKNSHKKVEITVMARDIMAGDDFVGSASLDVGHSTETKEVSLAIKRVVDKKKEKQSAGEIRLQYRFIPNLATTAATISASTAWVANNTVVSNFGPLGTDEIPVSM